MRRGFPASLATFAFGAVWLSRVALAAGPDFDREIAPILLKHCVECHGGVDGAGGLDLTTAEGLRKGGKTGPVLTPGAADESRLLERIVEGEMPPPKQGLARKLPSAEAESLRSWITAGAPWTSGRILDPFESTTATRAGRDWWALQPIRRPAIPIPIPIPISRPNLASTTTPTDNPIDAFIQSPLLARGWRPAPPADRRALIRRLSIDLLGLPPTFDEVEAFAGDPAPDAYERLVDRMLASPHFGERWARYWLDIVRYAETCGYERDQVKPNIWKYRDWVVNSFNHDLPYDRFIHQQLAGDELPDRDEASLIATGFLRLGTWNDEPNDPNEYQYERLEDLVHATSTSFLALTVKCARCHDHKFDPIRQTDYYRMAGAFWAGYIEPGPRDALGGPDPKTLGFDVHGWTDRGPSPPPLHLLKKGDPIRPGPVVEPALLSLLPALERPLTPPPPGSRTSLRRLQFAHWITHPDNPLTARVAVNRLWQFHFGQGLVRTPDNFGFNGEQPTHPDLLDWLASQLRQDGWTTKRLHRLMVLSATYRQASLHPRQDEYAQQDAANRLWWRGERRRLDAETLRDSLLMVAGNLHRERLGGPSFAPEIAADALEGLSMKGAAWKPSPTSEQGRRSLYIFSKRGLLPPLLTTFDFSDTTAPNCQRDVTTVPPQALTLLNNPFVHQQSESLANRAQAPANASDRAEQVRQVWRLCLNRPPRHEELTAALRHLDEQQRYFASIPSSARSGRSDSSMALASLCLVLLNTNEFLYVD